MVRREENKGDSGLAQLYPELLRCNRCGFCQGSCPTYKVTGLETAVARGHHSLLREIIEGRLDLSKETRGLLYGCLLCRGCVPPCMPAVETDKVVVRAREAYVDKFGLPWSRRWLFRSFLASTLLPSMASKVLALLRAAQIPRIARAVADQKSASLLAYTGVLPGPPGFQTLRQRLMSKGLIKGGGKGKRVTYFIGCGFNYLLPNVGEATVSLLNRLGFDVMIVNHVCCGLPAYAYGDRKGAQSMARKNLRQLLSLDTEAVVTECASCSSFLKEYRQLLADDTEYAEQAARLSQKVKDINEILADNISLIRPRHAKTDTRVTYHDPCHLVRYQGIKEQPRELLKSLGNLEFHELAEADWCCGAAGTYCLENPHESMEVLERKMLNLQASGAQVLVTSCPACILQLSLGVRQRGWPIKVVHLTEIMAQASR